MKKILLSLGMIVFVGVVVVGATGAFFSDTETSTGNTFTAGAIDLQIDNHAWYNGIECKWYENGVDGNNQSGWYWYGSSNDSYTQSLVGTVCTSSWNLSDLDGHLFFNFNDLKPGDWEEDTISIHVNNNDAWMCANLTVTSDDDVSTTEPEGLVDDLEDAGNAWDGELGSELSFIFWADDGDNVLETDENVVLSGSPSDLPSGLDNVGQTFPIADSQYSLFGGPVPGGQTVYIGKAFCFGDLVQTPVAQGANSPAVNPGFTCSGASTTNISQTDSLTADMSFTAVQSRNNDNFVCGQQ
jgi:predicted ribosomally synthesized peptide with SipW-like signal peptide